MRHRIPGEIPVQRLRPRARLWRALLAWGVLAAALGMAPSAARASDRIRVEVGGRLRYGPVDGHLQTGNGGNIGSSSFRRPTLEELDVDTAWAVGVSTRLFWRRHELHLEGDRIDLSGNGVLTEDLITQGDPYPAGTETDSDTYLLHAKATWRYHLPLRLSRCECLDLAPGLGVAVWGFRYQLEGSNGESADRRYTDWVPNASLLFSWRPSRLRNLTVSLEAGHSLTFLQSSGRLTDLLEVVGRVEWSFTRQMSVHLGVGYQHFLKWDDQPLPNRPHIDFGPWIEVGATWRF